VGREQALATILFHYRDVLGEELPVLTDLIRAPRNEPAPVVQTRHEVSLEPTATVSSSR